MLAGASVRGSSGGARFYCCFSSLLVLLALIPPEWVRRAIFTGLFLELEEGTGDSVVVG